jgi:histidinol-phosphatase (PHP family)
MRLATYHAHTAFCDGKNTAEEMTLAAIEAGMTDLGFSAHAAWPFSTEWHLDPKRYGEYLAETARVKRAYAGRITVLAGFEADYLAGVSFPHRSNYARFAPDFLIGSVHYVPSDKKKYPGVPWCVDAPSDDVGRGIAECFDGDGKRAAQAYWRAVRDMVGTCDFDIVGHLDVLRKRNGTLHFFDEGASWYIKEMEATAKAVARSGKIVEINTGGMARKAMDNPYPSAGLLARLCAHGVPITLSSDAHSAEHLVFAYDEARRAARKAGYATLSYKNPAGWVQEKF